MHDAKTMFFVDIVVVAITRVGATLRQQHSNTVPT